MLSIISKWLKNTAKGPEVVKIKQVDTYYGLTWKQIYEDTMLIA